MAPSNWSTLSLVTLIVGLASSPAINALPLLNTDQLDNPKEIAIVKTVGVTLPPEVAPTFLPNVDEQSSHDENMEDPADVEDFNRLESVDNAKEYPTTPEPGLEHEAADAHPEYGKEPVTNEELVPTSPGTEPKESAKDSGDEKEEAFFSEDLGLTTALPVAV